MDIWTSPKTFARTSLFKLGILRAAAAGSSGRSKSNPSISFKRNEVKEENENKVEDEDCQAPLRKTRKPERTRDTLQEDDEDPEYRREDKKFCYPRIATARSFKAELRSAILVRQESVLMI
jgi:hypothetical protein